MDININIADTAKSIMNWCMARTSDSHDAEDLSQDILCELVKSTKNLRDEKAFHAFMWGVANNVYKQWYKRKLKTLFRDCSRVKHQ